MGKVQKPTSAPEVYFHQQNDRKEKKKSPGLKKQNKNLDEMYRN